MTESFRTFRDLECWQACRELRLFVAKQVLPAIPRDEKYRLGDQVIRSGRSTTANVAEGYGRYHYLDNAKFCCNARGSAYEVLDHLITAFDEKMITPELFREGERLVETSVRLLNGYISYLQRSGNPSKPQYPISPPSAARISNHKSPIPIPHAPPISNLQ